MLAVTRLRPKGADRHTVVGLYLGGSYDACLAGCHYDQDFGAVALRSRALIRLRRYNDALAELDRNVDDENNAVRGELASLRSLSLAFLGRFDEASDAQRDARAYLFSVHAPALEAELHVNEAKLSFIRGHVAEARRLAETAFQATARFVETRGTEITSIAIARAEAGNLLCTLDLGEGKRTTAVRRFVESLLSISSSKLVDVGLIARLLANLSGNLQGIETNLERTSLALIRKMSATIEWTDDLSPHRFQILRELGLASALDGDHLSAFREYKLAFNIAPNRTLKLLALLDRVFLGRELKQTLVAHADLLEAQELANSIDWSTVEERELYCLLPLASLLAPIDVVAASRALRIYNTRKAKSTRTSSQFSDESFHADYLMATAAIARAELRYKDADRASTSAFEIFDGLGIRWRAAQAAYDLQETADRFKTYAIQEAARYPSSWLASKVRTAAN